MRAAASPPPLFPTRAAPSSFLMLFSTGRRALRRYGESGRREHTTWITGASAHGGGGGGLDAFHSSRALRFVRGDFEGGWPGRARTRQASCFAGRRRACLCLWRPLYSLHGMEFGGQLVAT